MSRFLALFLSLSVSLGAMDKPYPVFPGDSLTPSLQLSLEEIVSLPVRSDTCPVCGFHLEIPEVDKLVVQPVGGRWQMDASGQDSDLCPHPGPGKVAFQADIIICPDCGYAATLASFPQPPSAEFRTWVFTTLRPALRQAEANLLGWRGRELSGPDQLEFFNRQDAIPDRLRTENARVIAEVRRASLGEQAFLTWRAAWAARHALNRLPEIPLLTGWNRGALKNLALSDAQAALPILQRLSGRTRAGRPANSNPAERLAASILLAGVYDRLGEREAARQELTRLAGESHQRYADSRQDPFWPVVGGRPRAAEKATALDQVRRELEQEIANRQTILEDEYAYLGKATELLKDALEEAAYPTPGEALFHAYLLADFLRRLDQLPAASEWFKAVLSLSGANANLGEAARAGLEQVTRQAGERVNLLAGIGVDGELIEKLREICKNNPLNPTP